MDCVAAGDSPASDDSSETSTGIVRGLGRLSKPQLLGNSARNGAPSLLHLRGAGIRVPLVPQTPHQRLIMSHLCPDIHRGLSQSNPQ